MMTTLGKAVNRKLYNFIEDLVGRYSIDNERDMIPIVDETFTATTEDGTKITGKLNGYISIDDWYYDNEDCDNEDNYNIDTDNMFIHCRFEYKTSDDKFYLEEIHHF